MTQDQKEAAFQSALLEREVAIEMHQKAWRRRKSSQDSMTNAYSNRDRAHSLVKQRIEEHKSIRNRNDRKLKKIRSSKDLDYVKMSRSFSASQQAYKERRGADAQRLSIQAKRFKKSVDRYIKQTESLIEEIRDARRKVDDAQDQLNAAKREVKTTRTVFEAARDEHSRRKLRLAKAKQRVFEASEARVTNEEKIYILELADLSEENPGGVAVLKDEDDNFDIFYGGLDSPTGDGHGHIVVDSDGTVSHHRKPNSANSPENFANDQAFIDFCRSRKMKGGFGKAHYDHQNGKPVTVASGWGVESGKLSVVNGHIDKVKFHSAPSKVISRNSFNRNPDNL